MTTHETHSNQFGLVSGVHQPLSDVVLVAEPGALFTPEARKGRLYLVTELGHEAGRGREACQLVIRTIRKAFYEDSSYSITSSLRKAISVANQVLYQQNFSSSQQKRAVVGLTCAVVKDQDVYIAQVAPGQAYLLAEGKLRGLPTPASWTGGQREHTALLKPNALGASLTIEPEFYRAVLRPNDAVLLCSSNLAHLLSRDEATQVLHAPDASGIVDALLALCKRNELLDAHGIALSIAPPLSRAAQDAPLSRVGIGERSRQAVRSVGEQVAHLTGEAALLLKGPSTRRQREKAELRHAHEERVDTGLSQLPEEPLPPPTPPVPALDLGATLEERIAQERQERRIPLGLMPRPHSDEPVPPSAFLGETMYGTASASPKIDLSDTPSMAMLGSRTPRDATGQSLPIDLTLGERVGRVFDQLTDPINGIGQRRRHRAPPRPAPQARRQPGLSYRREKPPIPWVLFMLIIALVALLIVYGRARLNDNVQREAVDSLSVAEGAVAAIRSAPDEATADQRLDAAAAALNTVRSSTTITATADNRKRLEAIQREYERAQAAIQKLTYFDDLTVLGQHPQAAAGATFSTLIVPPPLTGITNTEGFSYIYALDANQGVLYRMNKSGGALEPLLSPTDVLEGSPVGKVKAVAWRIDNVVAIGQNEGGPTVYYFRENGKWRASILANSEDWSNTTKNLRLATYEGNLYLWGAADGQVLKYLSGRTGDPYDPWIKDDSVRKVTTASDIAVDGSIYLLLPSGRVDVFAANAFQRELAVPAVKPALDVVTTFFVTGTPDQGWIFILDIRKDRIVQIDKATGAVIQQITVHADSPVQLKAISAIAVDEQNEQQPQIYLVSGSQIVRATLPSAPKPFRAEPTSAPAVAPTTAP